MAKSRVAVGEKAWEALSFPREEGEGARVFRAEYEKRAKSGATGPIVGGTCWKKFGTKSGPKLCKKGTIGISSKVSIHTLIAPGEINPSDCQAVVGWSLMARQNPGQKTGQNLTKKRPKKLRPYFATIQADWSV